MSTIAWELILGRQFQHGSDYLLQRKLQRNEFLRTMLSKLADPFASYALMVRKRSSYHSDSSTENFPNKHRLIKECQMLLHHVRLMREMTPAVGRHEQESDA